MSLLRPILGNIVRQKSLFGSVRTITTSTVNELPCPQADMLKATMNYVPEYGWSMQSLLHGARHLGYPSVVHGVFPGGEAGLIDAYLKDARTTYTQLVEEKLAKGELEG
ncbi:hypothetical protein G6F56_013160 [Rhizopus delemar]|nr:hypothetical protein G6F56_013160 [Rhizopus delemar]